MKNGLSAQDQDAIQELISKAPPESEIKSLLLSISNLDHVDIALDRNAAIIGGRAVEDGLKASLSHVQTTQPPNPQNLTNTFGKKIDLAFKYGIISSDEAADIHIIRGVRNIFAHASTSICFSNAELVTMVSKLRSFPITDWTSYFAPAFSPRNRFAIVCGQYSVKLHSYKPSK